MSPKKSRVDRHVDQRRDKYSDELLAELPEETIREEAERAVQQENELMWALYRYYDISQREAISMTEPGVDISQSTASVVLREMEDEVLVEHTALSRAGEASGRTLGNHTDEYIETYRDLLAEQIVRREALDRLGRDYHRPGWVEAMYPELTDEARHIDLAAGLPEEEIPPLQDASGGASTGTAKPSDD